MDLPIKVLVYRNEDGRLTAEIPGMSGCITEADTREELVVNVREALKGWLGASQDRAIDEALAEGPADFVTL